MFAPRRADHDVDRWIIAHNIFKARQMAKGLIAERYMGLLRMEYAVEI